MKDIKLCPKNTEQANYGSGCLDFQIQEGHLQFVGGEDVIVQSVLKSTIASLNPNSGYGVAVSEFRGTKEIVPLRCAVMVRILRNAAIIGNWYGVKIRISKLDIRQNPASANFELTMEVNGIPVTV